MIEISIPPEKWNLLFINILFYQYIILFYFINIINILFYIRIFTSTTSKQFCFVSNEMIKNTIFQISKTIYIL